MWLDGSGVEVRVRLRRSAVLTWLPQTSASPVNGTSCTQGRPAGQLRAAAQPAADQEQAQRTDDQEAFRTQQDESSYRKTTCYCRTDDRDQEHDARGVVSGDVENLADGAGSAAEADVVRDITEERADNGLEPEDEDRERDDWQDDGTGEHEARGEIAAQPECAHPTPGTCIRGGGHRPVDSDTAGIVRAREVCGDRQAGRLGRLVPHRADSVRHPQCRSPNKVHG